MTFSLFFWAVFGIFTGDSFNASPDNSLSLFFFSEAGINATTSVFKYCGSVRWLSWKRNFLCEPEFSP